MDDPDSEQYSPPLSPITDREDDFIIETPVSPSFSKLRLLKQRNNRSKSAINTPSPKSPSFVLKSVRSVIEKLSDDEEDEEDEDMFFARFRKRSESNAELRSRGMTSATHPNNNVNPSTLRARLTKANSTRSLTSSAPLLPQGSPQPTLKAHEKAFLLTEDLAPCANPKSELKIALGKLKHDEWEVAYNAVDTLRRVCVFNASLIGETKTLLLEIADIADNLRSGLARNAIICIGELFKFFHPISSLDSEVSWLVPRLMRRYADGGDFIAKEVDKTLTIMAETVNRSKMVSALAAQARHKHVNVRNKSSWFLSVCLELPNSKELVIKEGEKIWPAISSLLDDSSGDARMWAKKACSLVLGVMNSRSELEPYVNRYLTESKVKQVIESAEKYKTSTTSKTTTIKPNMRRFSLNLSNRETLPRDLLPLGSSLPSIVDKTMKNLSSSSLGSTM